MVHRVQSHQLQAADLAQHFHLHGWVDVAEKNIFGVAVRLRQLRLEAGKDI